MASKTDTTGRESATPAGGSFTRHGRGGPLPHRLIQFAVLLALSLATRIAFFGDTNFHNDELFFFIVGQRMHDGLLPYVDVWDRKGPVLFAVYWLFAAFSRSILAYQIGAALFAAATALTAVLIAERLTGRRGAMLAGCFYLVMLPLFGGGGGQAPVIYNLFMALAALGVFSSLDRLAQGAVPRRAVLAMVSAGLAIACKQTALFEGAFLGCAVLWQLRRAGAPPGRLATIAAPLALAGAAPMLVFAACYAAIGHFAEFWHALVTANLVKGYDPGGDAAGRIRALAIIASPLLLPALCGFAVRAHDPMAGRMKGLVAGWLLAALTGVAIIPNFIDHYMLPLLLPLSVAAAPALGWRLLGPSYAVIAMAVAFAAGPSSKFAKHRESRLAMERIASDIARKGPRPRLLVYAGPTYLYPLAGSYPPSPLLLPTHLYYVVENDTSHLRTANEMRRILAWRPQVVVTTTRQWGRFTNQATFVPLQVYLRRCTLWATRPVIDYYSRYDVQIWGDCAAN